MSDEQKKRGFLQIFAVNFFAVILLAFLLGALYTNSPFVRKSLAESSMALDDYTLHYNRETLSETSILINISMESMLESSIVNNREFKDMPAMREFYSNHDNAPMWIGSDGSHPRAESVLAVLKDAWTHGLNPEMYHVKEIGRLINHPIQSGNAQLELLVSDAVIRYGQDISAMRINPKNIHQKAKYWREPLLGIDILESMRYESDPGMTLRELAPDNNLYSALREELIRVVGESDDYKDILPIDIGSKSLRPGNYHIEVPKLRVRLGVEYDPLYGARTKYDDPLAAAVISFQKKHELEADGIIGKKTLALLNNTREDRIFQIIANMERLRWQDQEKPDRYILVNVPSATLWAVDNNEVKIEQPVVVGTNVRPTISFKAEIEGVRFNPTWTVPVSIKMGDFLPHLKKDPLYLADKGFELYSGHGSEMNTIDPTAVDWSDITWDEMSLIRMVQSPGDHNALGRVRVLMKNPYNIYLHDTNDRELFLRTERSLSSGCIRMSDPEKVAAFILESNNEWSNSKMKKLIKSDDTHDIISESPMPVYILYQTIWLDNSGRLVFGHDIYKRDKQLVEELISHGKIHIPSYPHKYASNKNIGNTIDLDQ
jgi:murein L,D-transpeptidase YcbB/YkuD